MQEQPPTRAEFNELKEEVRQLREQRTEEMKALRVDVHNVDVETIKQELKTVSNTWLNTLQEHYTEHHADILALQESQADFRDTLLEVKRAMATKEDIASIKATQEQILQLLQQKQGE